MFVLSLLLAGSAACTKGARGCKVEDQCGRLLDRGVDRSCTEIKCVPQACGKEHYTVLGQEMCKTTPPLPPGEKPAPSTSAK